MNRLSSSAFSRIVLSTLAAACAAAAYSQSPAVTLRADVSTLPPMIAAVEPASLPAAPNLVTFSEVSSSTGMSDPSAIPPANGAGSPDNSSAAAANALPDAPSTTELHAAVPAVFGFDAPQATPNVAPRLTKYIPAGYVGQPLTAHDKVLVGLKDLYSPLNFIAMFAAAGYEQALNGEPNYGTDRGAFGERLGAAAIRESSQGLLTDVVFSPIFREDPRYYIQGQGHAFFYRAAYAATRPFITRTDSGNNTINAALLTGYAASAALSYTYYPSINQNFHDTASTFGGSLGGAALGYFVSEFSSDFFEAIHLKKK